MSLSFAAGKTQNKKGKKTPLPSTPKLHWGWLGGGKRVERLQGDTDETTQSCRRRFGVLGSPGIETPPSSFQKKRSWDGAPYTGTVAGAPKERDSVREKGSDRKSSSLL